MTISGLSAAALPGLGDLAIDSLSNDRRRWISFKVPVPDICCDDTDAMSPVDLQISKSLRGLSGSGDDLEVVVASLLL